MIKITKTIKLIDLLNKIANDELVPKRIKYCDISFTYNANERDYISEGGNYFVCSITSNELNEEIEIIEDTPEEDNKIEKLDLSDWWEITSSEDCKPEMLANIFNKNAKAFSRKLNEVIERLNEVIENENNKVN